MPNEEELMKTMKDTYYEVRIGTAMMVLIIITNLIMLILFGIGYYLWLDSTVKTQYNGATPKGETQNVQVP